MSSSQFRSWRKAAGILTQAPKVWLAKFANQRSRTHKEPCKSSSQEDANMTVCVSQCYIAAICGCLLSGRDCADHGSKSHAKLRSELRCASPLRVSPGCGSDSEMDLRSAAGVESHPHACEFAGGHGKPARGFHLFCRADRIHRTASGAWRRAIPPAARASN